MMCVIVCSLLPHYQTGINDVCIRSVDVVWLNSVFASFTLKLTAALKNTRNVLDLIFDKIWRQTHSH